jgi:hypothetical protein
MVQDPVPADFLMQISSDLGSHGHLPEIQNLVMPHFKPEIHGLLVSNNLLKTLVEMGNINQARDLLEQLYAIAAPSWLEQLDGWDAALTRASLAMSAPAEQEKPSVSTIVMEQPVWLDMIGVNAMLPPKRDDAIIIAVAGSTFEGPQDDKERAELMKNDAPGRISRAIPIFIADELRMKTDAKSRVLLPWVMNNGGGYVLYGKATPDEGVAQLGKLGKGQSSYVIAIHVNGHTTPWIAELRFMRVSDGQVLATKSYNIDPEHMEKFFHEIAESAIDLCVEVAKVGRTPAPEVYSMPVGHWFDTFLILGEQSLAFALAARFNHDRSSICGEYRITRDTLGLCYDKPESVPARLLLYSTLLHVCATRPIAIRIYKRPIEQLLEKYPLPEPFNKRVVEMQTQIFDHIK